MNHSSRARVILSCRYLDPANMTRHYRGESHPRLDDNVRDIRNILEAEMIDELSNMECRIIPDSIHFTCTI